MNILETFYIHQKTFKYSLIQKQPAEVFYKKGVLQNSKESTCAKVSFSITFQAKLTIKTLERRHQRRSGVFIGVVRVFLLTWPATLLKKGLWHRCFPVNFAKFRRTRLKLSS